MSESKTLDEKITKIAGKITFQDVNSSLHREIVSACYAAIRAFAEQVEDGALKCPDCNDVGWYADGTIEPTQQQCQFCYCEPNSIFNVHAMIAQAIKKLP